MIKNKLLLAIVIMFVLGIGTFVIADVLTSTTKSMTIDKNRLDVLKASIKGQAVAPKVSTVACDNKYCVASVYQEGLINSQFVTEKSYCSNLFINETSGQYTCLAYSDYTASELEKMRDAYVKTKLEQYADHLLSEVNKTEVVGGGVLNFTSTK